MNPLPRPLVPQRIERQLEELPDQVPHKKDAEVVFECRQPRTLVVFIHVSLSRAYAVRLCGRPRPGRGEQGI